MAKTPPAADRAPVLDDTVEVPAEGEAAPRAAWSARLRWLSWARRLPALAGRLPLPRIALSKKLVIIVAAAVFVVAGAGAAAYALWPAEPDWPRTPVVAPHGKKSKRAAAAKGAASAASSVHAAASAASSASEELQAAAAAADLPASGPEDSMDKLRRRLGEVMGGSTLQNDGPGELRLTARNAAASASRASPSWHAPGHASADVAARHAAAHAGESTVRAGDDHAARPPATGREPEGRAEPAAPAQHSHSAWSYEGPTGPQAWGHLKPEYAKCATGTRQSPIDIRDGIAVQLEPVKFEYRPSRFSVIDNGHTVQVNVAPGNFIEVGGRRFELQQFHFHRPSEERIEGRQFDMVAHLVHKDAEGRLAVVAVLLERGSAQPIVQAVWNNLPLEKGEEQAAPTPIDLAQLLPPERGYFTYMGSLTTPPCSEGVLWMVMKTPVSIASEQIAIFARLYPMNARPLQAASGRMIKESGTP